MPALSPYSDEGLTVAR